MGSPWVCIVADTADHRPPAGSRLSTASGRGVHAPVVSVGRGAGTQRGCPARGSAGLRAGGGVDSGGRRCRRQDSAHLPGSGPPDGARPDSRRQCYRRRESPVSAWPRRSRSGIRTSRNGCCRGTGACSSATAVCRGWRRRAAMRTSVASGWASARWCSGGACRSHPDRTDAGSGGGRRTVCLPG